MKYTAEEVRAIAKRLHDDITVADGDALMASDMLNAYAERIKADEGAVAIWQYRRTSDAQWLDCDELDADAWKQTGLHEVRKVFTRPPAQAAAAQPAERVPKGDREMIRQIAYFLKAVSSDGKWWHSQSAVNPVALDIQKLADKLLTAAQEADRAEPCNRNCDCVGPCKMGADR